MSISIINTFSVFMGACYLVLLISSRRNVNGDLKLSSIIGCVFFTAVALVNLAGVALMFFQAYR